MFISAGCLANLSLGLAKKREERLDLSFSEYVIMNKSFLLFLISRPHCHGSCAGWQGHTGGMHYSKKNISLWASIR